MSDVKALLTMIEAINTRTLDIQKEMNKLKYLFGLKQGREIASSLSVMTEEDKKAYTVKSKMYLGKLQNGEIKQPKDTTLKYYGITFENETYKFGETAWKIH